MVAFSLIKRLYRKTAVDCVDRVVDVVKKPSIAGVNKAQGYGKNGFQYFDIISGLETYFKKSSGLQRFQHFFSLMLVLAWSKPKKSPTVLLKNSSYQKLVNLRLRKPQKNQDLVISG